jgi:hypothetical protein
MIVIAAFLFQFNLVLQAQSEDEFVSELHRVKKMYNEGIDVRLRIERLLDIMKEKRVDRKDILGECHLLLGAIYEKEKKETSGTQAEKHYTTARDVYGVTKVDGVDLDSLQLYSRIFKVGVIEAEGDQAKKGKKKFPWLLVAGGVVVVGVILILLLKKKKKFTLNVSLAEGVDGNPGGGQHQYKKGTQVSYSYSARSGYGNLNVTVDGSPAEPSGTIVMNSNHTLNVTAEALGFVTNKTEVDIPEGGFATFTLALSARPQSDVHVQVSHVEGDSDIRIISGGVLTFTPENWDSPQTVTLRAEEDNQDIENGQATLRVEALGGEVPALDIIAREIDNDNLTFETNTDDLTVEEGKRASFRVRLSSGPSINVTATIMRISGDTDITLKSPNTLTFTPNNWGDWQEVTVEAADDLDTKNDTAIFRISADNLPDKDIRVTESDTDVLHFISNTDSLIVDEGGSGAFQVKLSAMPSGTVTASAARSGGDSDIDVAAGSSTLTFNTVNWDTYQTVTVTAAEDDDGENGEATIRVSADGVPNKDVIITEADNDPLGFETDLSELTVEEEGTNTFQVRLTAQPPANVSAGVFLFSGDSDISVASSPVLLFTPSDWHNYQTVTLAAAKDEDEENGQAAIRIAADGIPSKDIAVTESDTGPGDPPEVSISEPLNGATVSGDVIIKAVASDDFGVSRVEFYIDDNLHETLYAPPYHYEWPTVDVPLGDRRIKVIAYDAIDQDATVEITVTVVDDQPVVDSLQLTPDTSPASGTVSVSIAASDYRGVKEIQFFIDDVLKETWTGTPQPEVNFTFDLDTTAYSNGAHTFKAIAKDTADQESTPFEVNVTIQN